MIHLATALIRAALVHPVTLRAVCWCGQFVARMLAGSLNVPEALVHHTGAFAVAYIEAVERRVTLVCPIRRWRDLKGRAPRRRGSKP
jgi:hypothetical protein